MQTTVDPASKQYGHILRYREPDELECQLYYQSHNRFRPNLCTGSRRCLGAGPPMTYPGPEAGQPKSPLPHEPDITVSIQLTPGGGHRLAFVARERPPGALPTIGTDAAAAAPPTPPHPTRPMATPAGECDDPLRR